MEELAPDEPQEIAGYRLVGRLGQGGMGMVYLSHTRGGQPVALKVVRPEYAQDPDFRRRFAQEVVSARRVQGPYTAPVLDSNTEGPEPWLAVAYVPGPPLVSAVSRHGALPVPTVLKLTAGVAEALQTVHAAGVVHRDLKPSNVLLASDGPRVIDFGIARAADATSLTGTDARLGTPAFMAPEQAMGGDVTPALDVFALGLTIHFAATQQHPHGEGASAALLFRIVAEEPDLTGCPDELRGLVSRCLAKEPTERPTPQQVIEECNALAGTAGIARGSGWWLPPSVARDIEEQEETLRLASSSGGSSGASSATPGPGASPERSAASEAAEGAAPAVPPPPAAAPPGAVVGQPPTQPAYSPATAAAAQAPTTPLSAEAQFPEGPPGFGPTAPVAHTGAEPPPRRRGRTALVVAGAVAAVLIIGAGSIFGYTQLTGDGGDTNQSQQDDTSGGGSGGEPAPPESTSDESGESGQDGAEEDSPSGSGGAKDEEGWRITEEDRNLTLRGPQPSKSDRVNKCDTYHFELESGFRVSHPGSIGAADALGQLAYHACQEPEAEEGLQATDGSIMDTTKERFPTPSQCQKTARDSSLPNPVPLKKLRDDSVLKENTGLCVETSDKAVAHLWIRKINRAGDDGLPTYVTTATLWEPER